MTRKRSKKGEVFVGFFLALPTVEKLDKRARKNFRTRSAEIRLIVSEALQ